MTYDIYKAIKDRITEQISEFRSVEKYVGQLDGTIHAEPACYIQFPDPIDVTEISKQTSRNPITIKVHVVSKAMRDTDSVVDDVQVRAHDALSAKIITELAAFQLTKSDAALCTKMLYKQYEESTEYPGWLVTWLIFTVKK